MHLGNTTKCRPQKLAERFNFTLTLIALLDHRNPCDRQTVVLYKTMLACLSPFLPLSLFYESQEPRSSFKKRKFLVLLVKSFLEPIKTPLVTTTHMKLAFSFTNNLNELLFPV